MSAPLFVVDIVRDQSGVAAVSLFGGERHRFQLMHGPIDRDWLLAQTSPASTLVCFDCRALFDAGIDPTRIVDLQLARPVSFRSAAQGMPEARECLELESALRSSAAAAKTARVDLTKHSLFRMVPPTLIRRLFEVRARIIWSLHEMGPLPDLGSDGMALMAALRHMELAGAAVDVSMEEDLWQRVTDLGNSPELKFFRGVMLNQVDGLVHTRYSPVGAKTGRVRVDSGFNIMSVPRGLCREAFVSRFSGGRVCSFDFNAIDYRCIIASIPELAPLYQGAHDFHLRTQEILGRPDLSREQVKFTSYVYIYGGSLETCVERTGLSVEDAQSLLTLFNERLRPIMEFRRRLHAQAHFDGCVALPSGRRVTLGMDDHPGKVLGLYAQTFSSETFGKALVAADALVRGSGFRSVLSFPVHDELVVDLHPDEDCLVSTLKGALEAAAGPGHAVKANVGRNYREASEK